MRYSLSYRILVEVMEERSLLVAHTTIMQYGPELDTRMRCHPPARRVDETNTKVKVDMRTVEE